VRYQGEAEAEWMSQFCGCKPTAYESVALVSYSTFWPGVVVAGVVAVTVVGVSVAGVSVAGVAASDVADGAATRVRDPVEAGEEGAPAAEGPAEPQPANVAPSNAATPSNEAKEVDEGDRRVEGHTAPRA
jgi:hypothetical protein